jgi:hypothetical protein
MFNCLSNNRINRFAGAKVIGRGPRWRKGSRFDVGEKWRRPLDRNDRARVMVYAEGLERRTKHKHKRDGVIGVTRRFVQNRTLSCLGQERSANVA